MISPGNQPGPQVETGLTVEGQESLPLLGRDRGCQLALTITSLTNGRKHLLLDIQRSTLQCADEAL